MSGISLFPAGLRAGCGIVQVAPRVRHLEHLPHQVHQEIRKQAPQMGPLRGRSARLECAYATTVLTHTTLGWQEAGEGS